MSVSYREQKKKQQSHNFVWSNLEVDNILWTYINLFTEKILVLLTI